MTTLLETDDPVRLHYIRAMLEAADLHPFCLPLDSAYRSMLTRLMVPDSEAELARHVIAEADKSV